jgi:hypothetical protein
MAAVIAENVIRGPQMLYNRDRIRLLPDARMRSSV